MKPETKLKSCKRFTRSRIGVQLNNLLETKEIFLNNPDTKTAAMYLLKTISKLNHEHNGAWYLSYRLIENLFRPYTGGSYQIYVDALIALNLLVITDEYVLPKFENGIKTEDGECRYYLVTDLTHKLLLDGNKKYLYDLHYDKKTMRTNQQRISKSKVLNRKYEDVCLQHNHDVVSKMEYDLEKANSFLRKTSWSDDQKHNVTDGLLALTTKDIPVMEYKKVDGRVYDPEVNLKKEARHLLHIKNHVYKSTLDVRACHASFFSSYILSLLYPLLIAYDKCDKRPPFSNICENGYNKSALEAEHQKWMDLFSDPQIDPRKVISDTLDMDYDRVKDGLNSTLNGSQRYPKILGWLKDQFPTLYSVWQRTDVSQTGPGISKQYESVLMYSPKLIELANEMDIIIKNEHDGLGILSRPNDNQLQSKMDMLVKYLQDRSIQLFGVPIVIKTEILPDFSNLDLMSEMTWKLKEVSKYYNAYNDDEELQRKIYFVNKDEKQLGKWLRARDRLQDLLFRYRDVIYYWAKKEKYQPMASPFEDIEY